MLTIAPGCCCPTPGVCGNYRVKYCTFSTTADGPQSAWAKAGTTVEVYPTAGGAMIASGVTDATGTVRLCLPTAGTYKFRVVGNEAVQDFDQNATTTTGSKGLFVPSSALRENYCCAGQLTVCSPGSPAVFRRPLYLTDRFGTWAPTSASCFAPQYSCQGHVSPALVPGPPDGLCDLSDEGGVIHYGYSVSVKDGSVSVIRTWSIATKWYEPGGQAYWATPTCGTSAGIASSSGEFPFSDCRNIFVSGSLTPFNLALPDPVGGTVALSV